MRVQGRTLTQETETFEPPVCDTDILSSHTLRSTRVGCLFPYLLTAVKNTSSHLHPWALRSTNLELIFKFPFIFATYSQAFLNPSHSSTLFSIGFLLFFLLLSWLWKPEPEAEVCVVILDWEGQSQGNESAGGGKQCRKTERARQTLCYTAGQSWEAGCFTWKDVVSESTWSNRLPHQSI